ncbi:MAG: hypothetical protein V3T17_02885 [Pseudomonadales bacterium]
MLELSKNGKILKIEIMDEKPHRRFTKATKKAVRRIGRVDAPPTPVADFFGDK